MWHVGSLRCRQGHIPLLKVVPPCPSWQVGEDPHGPSLDAGQQVNAWMANRQYELGAPSANPAARISNRLTAALEKMQMLSIVRSAQSQMRHSRWRSEKWHSNGTSQPSAQSANHPKWIASELGIHYSQSTRDRVHIELRSGNTLSRLLIKCVERMLSTLRSDFF